MKALFKFLKKAFCAHYFPGSPVISFENETIRIYEWKCAKCGHIDKIVGPNR